jgi:predicted acylesterase/phospholipase RssA
MCYATEALRQFRSYHANSSDWLNCTIWQAARATLAIPGIFPEVTIGENLVCHAYVSGTLGGNNPSKAALEEYHSQYTNERIAALISIGAGQTGAIKLLNPSSSADVDAATRKIVTDAEPVAEALEHRFRNQGFYFRLNVGRGLQVTTENNKINLGEVEAHTKDYLKKAFGGYYIVENVVKCLRGEDVVFSDRMSMSTSSG